MLTINDYLFPTPQTANAHIIRENQTLNNELTEQQTKTGQLLVENTKHKMASIQLRRELETSTMREWLLKKRVDKLNEENANLRHFAKRQTKHTSANGLLSSLSDLFDGDNMGDFKKRHGASSNPGSRSVSATHLSRANSYGLKSCASAAIAGTSSFHGNTAARASFSHGTCSNASWDVPGSAAPIGGMNIFLGILEGEAT